MKAIAYYASLPINDEKSLQDIQLPEPVAATRQIGVGFLAVDEYVIPFELAAIVLTVALVAAVYIARRRRSDLSEEGVNS